MSEQDDNKQLEDLIKNVFIQAKQKSITPKEVRLNNIIRRCFYEVALKDVMTFTNQLITSMLSMMSLFIKAFSTLRK